MLSVRPTNLEEEVIRAQHQARISSSVGTSGNAATSSLTRATVRAVQIKAVAKVVVKVAQELALQTTIGSNTQIKEDLGDFKDNLDLSK